MNNQAAQTMHPDALPDGTLSKSTAKRVEVLAAAPVSERAREFLADEYDNEGVHGLAESIRAGTFTTHLDQCSINAITNALASAPDGFALVPVEPTAAMKDAGDYSKWNYDDAADIYKAMLRASGYAARGAEEPLIALEQALTQQRGSLEPIAWSATDYQADGPNTQYTSDPHAAEYYASIGLDVRPLYGSTTPQPQAAAGGVDRYAEGIEAAAKWLDAVCQEFCEEHGHVESDTNALTFGRGKNAEAKEEYVQTLEELAAGVRTLIDATPTAGQGGDYSACCDTPAYCSSVRRCTAKDSATPAPAASVSERARIDALALDVARRFTLDTEPQRRASLQVAVIAALEQALTQQRGEAAAHASGVPGRITDSLVSSVEAAMHACYMDHEDYRLTTSLLHDMAVAAVNVATTPQPSADAVRELVKRWRAAGDVLIDSQRVAYASCADELESLLARGAP